MYSVKDAKNWLKKHKYKHGKVDETLDYYRFRQHDPDLKKEFRTIDFGKNTGIKGIIEYEK